MARRPGRRGTEFRRVCRARTTGVPRRSSSTNRRRTEPRHGPVRRDDGDRARWRGSGLRNEQWLRDGRHREGSPHRCDRRQGRTDDRSHRDRQSRSHHHVEDPQCRDTVPSGGRHIHGIGHDRHVEHHQQRLHRQTRHVGRDITGTVDDNARSSATTSARAVSTPTSSTAKVGSSTSRSMSRTPARRQRRSTAPVGP